MDLQLAEARGPDAIENYPDRVAERKLDGVRLHTPGGRLVTRRGNDVTDAFPELRIPEGLHLDGEVVTANFDFETVLSRVQTETPWKVDLLREKHPAVFVPFDALEIDGQEVRSRALYKRQEAMREAVRDLPNVCPITTRDDAAAAWREAVAAGWEGIILKDPTAAYQEGRGSAWLKVKQWREGEFDVIDHEWTDDGGFVVFVDIGTDEPQKVAVQSPPDRQEIEAGISRVEIQYLERSSNNRLRKPSYRGAVA